MGVDDVLRLLTATFDVDYLDTLSAELQKHLTKETEKPAADIPGIGRVLSPQHQLKPL